MSINFSTYSKELNDSKNKLMGSQDSTNWVLYGYGLGNDLKFTGSGDGGLEELKDEFEGSKVQFALARVIDPNSNLPKIILISWCPDGVPVARKGLFNVHVNEASHYFKGYHLHIQARHEEDIDPSHIMEKVKQASGAKYSIQQGVANPSLSKPEVQAKPFIPPPSVASSSSFTPVQAKTKPTNSYSPLMKPKPATLVSSGVTASNSYTPPVNKPDIVKSEVTPSNSYQPAINSNLISSSKPVNLSSSSYVPPSVSNRSQAFTQPASVSSLSSYQPIKLNPKPLYGEGVATAVYVPPSESISSSSSSYVPSVAARNFNGAPTVTSPRNEPAAKPKIEPKNSYVPSKNPISFNGTPSPSTRESVNNRPLERKPSYVPPTTPISFNGVPPPTTSPGRESVNKPVLERKSSYVPPVVPVSFNGGPPATSPGRESVNKPVLERKSSYVPPVAPVSFNGGPPAWVKNSASTSASARSSTTSPGYKMQEEQERLRLEREREEQISVRAKMEQIRIKDEQDRAQKEQQKLEQQRAEQQRIEQKRAEQQRLEQQNLEQQRLEQQRLEQQKLEEQRLEQQRLEQKRLEEQRFEQQRLEQERLEQQRLEAARYEQHAQEELQRQQSSGTNAPPSDSSLLKARALYDYTPAEANEISLREGGMITQIVQIDEGWWEGTNSSGQRGFFPSNYVEIEPIDADVGSRALPNQSQIQSPENQPSENLPRAITLYDYDAAENNELTFAADEVITDIEFVSDDWWSGKCRGIIGLFPSNYVQLQN